jgi:hypothetical protein
MRRFLTLICLLLFSAYGLPAQKMVFEGVKIHRHRSAEKRVLIDKLGTLTFDDSARKLTFDRGADDHIEVGYDEVGMIVFESTARMRGGELAAVVQAAPLAGPVVGAAVAGAHVNDYWFYLDYKNRDQSESALMVVPKNSSERVIAKATSLFGSRATVTDFPEKGAAVKVGDLKASKSKQALKVGKLSHPLPELESDKATVVVVCSPLPARYAGRGNQFKLHANDQVIAMNKWGTYSFAYLDPGKYRLVSRTENTDGFEMELEAGHE